MEYASLARNHFPGDNEWKMGLGWATGQYTSYYVVPLRPAELQWSDWECTGDTPNRMLHDALLRLNLQIQPGQGKK